MRVMSFKFKKIIQDGMKSFNFGGTGGSQYAYQDPWGSYFRPVAGAQFDYRREVGIPWENSAVMACVNYVSRTFPEAILCVERKDATSTSGWTKEFDHPVLDLLRFPNPDNPQSYLWSGAILSYMIDGNSFWYVEKNALDTPIGLYYIPHFQITPRWPEKGNVFIQDYLRRVGTQMQVYKPDEIIQICQGVDPNNTRRGMSPLAAVLREVCTDNEASTAAAAIMRNLGVPGLTFTPDPASETTPEQLQKIREISRMKMTGDRRGELLTMPIPGKFDQFGFSPEQLAFDKIRNVPEERISAIFGIPAVVAGLGAGLDRSTYSNFEQAREAAYESCLVPMWRNIAEQLSNKLLPMFGEDPKTTRIIFDINSIQALQEDQNEKHKRIRDDWEKGMIKRNEARVQLGFNYNDDKAAWAADDVYITDLPKKLEEEKDEEVEDVKTFTQSDIKNYQSTKSDLEPHSLREDAAWIANEISADRIVQKRASGIPMSPTDTRCTVCRHYNPTSNMYWHDNTGQSMKLGGHKVYESPWGLHLPKLQDQTDLSHKPVCPSCQQHLVRLWNPKTPDRLLHIEHTNLLRDKLGLTNTVADDLRWAEEVEGIADQLVDIPGHWKSMLPLNELEEVELKGLGKWILRGFARSGARMVGIDPDIIGRNQEDITNCQVCNDILLKEKAIWHKVQPDLFSGEQSPPVPGLTHVHRPWTPHIPARAEGQLNYPHKPVCQTCYTHLDHLWNEAEPTKIIHQSKVNATQRLLDRELSVWADELVELPKP